jgi:hypothetical protein
MPFETNDYRVATWRRPGFVPNPRVFDIIIIILGAAKDFIHLLLSHTVFDPIEIGMVNRIGRLHDPNCEEGHEQ